MLEGLDEIDWAALEHAYGPATDVPTWIRALRSPDPEVREWARDDWNIVHQGTRYSATAPAVPFLVELALAHDTPGRDWVVGTLAYAAIGYGAESLPEGIAEVTLDRLARTTRVSGEERTFGPWALAAYEAVEAAVPTLLPLLDDEDASLRRETAYLLAWFPRSASRSLPPLRARIASEPDLDAKATMVIALGLLAGGRGETGDGPRLEALLRDGDAVVRWAAAVALARLFPQAPPEPAFRELLGWLTGVTTAGRGAEVPFQEPEYYAMLVLRSVPALRERAVEAIMGHDASTPSADPHAPMRNLKRLALEDLPDDPTAFPPLANRVLGQTIWPAGRWG